MLENMIEWLVKNGMTLSNQGSYMILHGTYGMTAGMALMYFMEIRRFIAVKALLKAGSAYLKACIVYMIGIGICPIIFARLIDPHELRQAGELYQWLCDGSLIVSFLATVFIKVIISRWRKAD